MIIGRFAPKFRSVSYTHLDVYKRQNLGFLLSEKTAGKRGRRKKVKQTKCGSLKAIFRVLKFVYGMWFMFKSLGFDVLCYTFAIKSITIGK